MVQKFSDVSGGDDVHGVPMPPLGHSPSPERGVHIFYERSSGFIVQACSLSQSASKT